MNDEYVSIDSVIKWYSKKKKNSKDTSYSSNGSSYSSNGSSYSSNGLNHKGLLKKCDCQHSVSSDGEHRVKGDTNMYIYQIQPNQSTIIIKPVGTVQNTHDITINKFDYYVFNCRIVSKVYTFTELIGENIFSLVKIIISQKNYPKIVGVLSYKFHCLEGRVEKEDINKDIGGYYLIDLVTNKTRYILYNKLRFHNNDAMISLLVKYLKNKDVIETIINDVEKNL